MRDENGDEIIYGPQRVLPEYRRRKMSDDVTNGQKLAEEFSKLVEVNKRKGEEIENLSRALAAMRYDLEEARKEKTRILAALGHVSEALDYDTADYEDLIGEVLGVIRDLRCVEAELEDKEALLQEAGEALEKAGYPVDAGGRMWSLVERIECLAATHDHVRKNLEATEQVAGMREDGLLRAHEALLAAGIPENDKDYCPDIWDIAARISKLTEQRDLAQKNYQHMVDKACEEKLDGYRELGAKCAALEAERDHFKALAASERSVGEGERAYADDFKAECEKLREANKNLQWHIYSVGQERAKEKDRNESTQEDVESLNEQLRLAEAAVPEEVMLRHKSLTGSIKWLGEAFENLKKVELVCLSYKWQRNSTPAAFLEETLQALCGERDALAAQRESLQLTCNRQGKELGEKTEVILKLKSDIVGLQEDFDEVVRERDGAKASLEKQRKEHFDERDRLIAERFNAIEDLEVAINKGRYVEIERDQLRAKLAKVKDRRWFHCGGGRQVDLNEVIGVSQYSEVWCALTLGSGVNLNEDKVAALKEALGIEEEKA